MEREDVVLSALIIEDWCEKHRNHGGGPCDCPLQVANMCWVWDKKPDQWLLDIYINPCLRKKKQRRADDEICIRSL